MIINEKREIRVKKQTGTPLRFTLILLSAIALLLFSMFIAISMGAKSLTLHTVWDAVFSYNRSLSTHQIIQEIRLPRVLAAAVVGAAFAVAGALMQGLPVTLWLMLVCLESMRVPCLWLR